MTAPTDAARALLSSSPAVDGFLILAGVMAARAARRGAQRFSDLSRFFFWRTLRFAPSLLVGFALFAAISASLTAHGLSSSVLLSRADVGFLDVNASALILFAAWIGSILLGVAFAFGVIGTTIGRSGVAAFAAACVAARFSPGMELSATADLAARIGAAFAFGVFLEGAAATGGFSRAIRRMKTGNASGVEAAGFTFIVAVLALLPRGAAPLAPVMLLGALAIFTRKRGAFADQTLGAVFGLRCGRAAAPIIGCAFVLTWPVLELSAAHGGFTLSAALASAPVYLGALFGLAFAVRQLVEDPMSAFAALVKREARAARRELEALQRA